MSNAFFRVPEPVNEPVCLMRREVLSARPFAIMVVMQAQEIEIPLIIGGEAISTGNVAKIRAPHDHSIKLGIYHKAGNERSTWPSRPRSTRMSCVAHAVGASAARFF